MAVFGWLLLIWIVGVFPPLGVIIGILALIWSIKDIVIGNKVMFGPRVTIIGGDHNTGELGQYM